MFAMGRGSGGSGFASSFPPRHSNRKHSARCPSASLPPTHTTPVPCVPLTP